MAQWLKFCATNPKVAGSIPAGFSGFFTDIKSFRSHYGPGVDSSSNRNEYQEYFLGVKAAGADNPPPSCAVVTKSGNLNFLEPSGPLRACNGTDLPLESEAARISETSERIHCTLDGIETQKSTRVTSAVVTNILTGHLLFIQGLCLLKETRKKLHKAVTNHNVAC